MNEDSSDPLYVPDGAAAPRSGGALCDVGPTILEWLGLDRPAEMSGRSLLGAAR